MMLCDCESLVEVEEISSVLESEVLGNGNQLLVADGVDSGLVVGQHVQLCGLLNRFNQTECLVDGLADTVDAVQAPNNDSEFLHLLCGSDTDLVVSANHPGKNTDAVGEYNDALGAHLPNGVGELLLIQLMNVVHRQGIGGVGVHDNSVVGVNLQSCHVAHQVSGEFGCELSTIGIAPKKLCGGGILCDADDAEVVLGIILNVLEIFARTGYKEYLTLSSRTPALACAGARRRACGRSCR